jgi:hypothetical protein
MASTNLDLGEELGALLEKLGQPVEQTAREMSWRRKLPKASFELESTNRAETDSLTVAVQ